jgi:hypothetical protein
VRLVTVTRPRRAGRPRGSGQQQRLVSVQLAPVERIPWQAGYRIGLADQWLAASWDGDVAELFHLLTELERDAVWAGNSDRFSSWLRIGLRCARLDEDVRILRGQ